MRKLKLESLIVETFETTAVASRGAGTVRGNEQVAGTGQTECQVCVVLSEDWFCQTDSPEICGDTNYLDCTFICSAYETC